MIGFLKKAGLYAVPDMLGKSLPFLILPVITRYLSLQDFGLVALFGLCMIPFNVLTEFGSGYIINALWFKSGPEDRGRLLSTLLALRFGLLAASALLLAPLAGRIYPLIVGEEWPALAGLFPWFLLFALSSFVLPIFNSWIVMEGRARDFALLGSAQAIATSLATLFTAMTGNYRVVIVGGVLVGTAFAGVRFAILIPHLGRPFARHLLGPIWRMGWPIMLRSVFNQVRTKFDKIYLASLYGGSRFALYNWANSAYRAYPTLESHVAKVFEPPYLKQLADGRVDLAWLRRLFFAWFYLILCGSAACYFLAKPAISLLTNDVFTGAYEPLLLFTGLAVLGTLLMGQTVPIVHAQKTRWILGATVCSASVGLASCLLLIPRLGPNGAAVSLFLAQVATLIVYVMGRRTVYKPWIVEGEILPYALAYWTLVGLRVFAGIGIGVPLALLVGVATAHLWKRGGLAELESLLKRRRRAAKPIS